MATESSDQSGALAYSRGVHASMLDWYKVADSKGQLLLTLNGIYITVLSSITIASSQDLVKRHASLPPATGFLLAGAAAATAVSILSAVTCLYSRMSNATLDKLRNFPAERDAGGGVQPAALFWFGTIARVDRAAGLTKLQSADEAFELSALTENIFRLAPIVLAKHRWANRGWAAAGTSLLLLLAAAVSPGNSRGFGPRL